jgi:hypothetical protein
MACNLVSKFQLMITGFYPQPLYALGLLGYIVAIDIHFTTDKD